MIARSIFSNFRFDLISYTGGSHDTGFSLYYSNSLKDKDGDILYFCYSPNTNLQIPWKTKTNNLFVRLSILDIPGSQAIVSSGTIGN